MNDITVNLTTADLTLIRSVLGAVADRRTEVYGRKDVLTQDLDDLLDRLPQS